MIIPTQIPISPLTLSLISGIHELKGALRAASHMAPERMLALRQVATLESVASGVRLGNVVLSDTEVRRMLARLHPGSHSKALPELEAAQAEDEFDTAANAAGDGELSGGEPAMDCRHLAARRCRSGRLLPMS